MSWNIWVHGVHVSGLIAYGPCQGDWSLVFGGRSDGQTRPAVGPVNHDLTAPNMSSALPIRTVTACQHKIDLGLQLLDFWSHGHVEHPLPWLPTTCQQHAGTHLVLVACIFAIIHRQICCSRLCKKDWVVAPLPPKYPNILLYVAVWMG